MEAELTWIGTATTLLRLGPFTLLTDPNFLHEGEYAYLGYGLVSKRRTDPALDLHELPALDAVVLSHRHGDHWDRRASHGLDKSLPVLTTTHAAPRLRSKDGFDHAIGLDTWQQHALSKAGATLTVTSLPGVHSTNALVRALLPPVMGALLELTDWTGTPALRVYLTGDTMVFDGLDEIGRRHPDIDAAVVHGGGTTLPGGVVVTMTGDGVVECLRRVRPRVGVPIHYGDYGVFKSGLEDIRRAFDASRLPVELRVVERGGAVSLHG
ncbi:MAG TPA: MBL fold metallo-hydrolase [Mycobacteriales bacterium]|nr:MBL fold metallo-hydrolase [Mycobacteriales bacterium]